MARIVWDLEEGTVNVPVREDFWTMNCVIFYRHIKVGISKCMILYLQTELIKEIFVFFRTLKLTKKLLLIQKMKKYKVIRMFFQTLQESIELCRFNNGFIATRKCLE
jgi:high-affinity Fe2+/Pb2+ permease